MPVKHSLLQIKSDLPFAGAKGRSLPVYGFSADRENVALTALSSVTLA